MSPKQEQQAFLDDAAKELGVEPSELSAEDRGKSVAGLVQATVAAKTKVLDEAVEAGRLNDAERDEIVAGLRARVADLVDGRFSPRHRHESRERRGDRILFPTA